MGFTLLKRLGATALMLLGAVIGTFLLTHVVPADPAQIAAGLNATPAQVAHVRQELGLDKPLIVQLGIFLADLLHGDLGTSFVSQRDVATDIATFFPATFELVLWAIVIMVVVGVPIGLYSVLGRSRIAANIIRLLSFTVMGVPAFVIALVAQIVFFGVLGWFPSGGRIAGTPPAHITGLYTVDAVLTGNWPAFGSALLHLLLPAASLAIYRVGMIARYTESEVQRAMHSDYVRTARAKGARLPRILAHHVARNAVMPVLTIVGLEFGWLLGGSILVESIFSWPGMGQYILSSVAAFDFSPVIVSTLVLAAAFAVINLLVDIVQTLLDPRVRQA
jgi:peptide/nickel transport system permease protein